MYVQVKKKYYGPCFFCGKQMPVRRDKNGRVIRKSCQKRNKQCARMFCDYRCFSMQFSKDQRERVQSSKTCVVCGITTKKTSRSMCIRCYHLVIKNCFDQEELKSLLVVGFWLLVAVILALAAI